MLINQEFKELVQKKYEEAIEKNETSIVLDEKTLGGLILFIDTKPVYSIASFEVEGKKLYVGSNDITKTF